MPTVLASTLFGDTPQLLQLLLLAFGGALFAGNLAALVKPPPRAKDGALERAPRGRTITMAVIGFVVSVWAIASLLA